MLEFKCKLINFFHINFLHYYIDLWCYTEFIKRWGEAARNREKIHETEILHFMVHLLINLLHFKYRELNVNFVFCKPMLLHKILNIKINLAYFSISSEKYFITFKHSNLLWLCKQPFCLLSTLTIIISLYI